MRRVAVLAVLVAGLLPGLQSPATAEPGTWRETLSTADRNTAEGDLVSVLEALSETGTDGAAAGPLLVSLLAENADLYRGRGPREVIRLRACLLATLAAIGPPPEALAPVRAELAHGYWPLLQAAAARAAGALGSDAASAVPDLLQVLSVDTHDDKVPARICGVDRSQGLTTARLEAVRALARIGPAAGRAVPLLERIVTAREGTFYSGLEELRAAARLAAAELRQVEMVHGEHGGHHSSGRQSPEPAGGAALASPWLPPESRRSGPFAPAIHATDQDGVRCSLASLRGTPVALTFFYTRCDNPDKCPVTVARLAGLQAALSVNGLSGSAQLVAVSLDPELDNPGELKRFGDSLGVRFDAHTRFLNLARPDLETLLRRIDAAVSFGAGRVSSHGVQLYLFDRQGRYVRDHHSVAWDQRRVVEDLRRLADEAD